MSIGYQYFAAESAVALSGGYFHFDISSPPGIITFNNLDSNANVVFPITSAFSEFIQGPTVVGLDLYTNNYSLGATVWIDLSTETAVSLTATQYNVVDFVLGTSTSWEAETIFFALIRFGRGSSGVTGPEGPQGPVGETGVEGPQGPTGPAVEGGVAVLRSSDDQTISSATATPVVLDTVGVAATSGNLTTNTTAGLITCVNTGVYLATARVNWTATVASGVYQLTVMVNDTPYQSVNAGVLEPAQSVTYPSDNGQTISVVLDVTSPNTTVGLQVSQNSSASQLLSGTGAVASSLSVHRLA